MGASGLGPLLVREGFLTERDWRVIAKTAGNGSWAIAKGILAAGLLDEDELVSLLADRTNFKVVSKAVLRKIDPALFTRIGSSLCLQLEVLPVTLEKNILTIAVLDPLDRGTVHQMEFFTHYKIVPVIASHSLIRTGLRLIKPDFEPTPSSLECFLSNHVMAALRYQKLQDKIRKAPPEPSETTVADSSNSRTAKGHEQKSSSQYHEDVYEELDSDLLSDDFGDESAVSAAFNNTDQVGSLSENLTESTNSTGGDNLDWDSPAQVSAVADNSQEDLMGDGEETNSAVQPNSAPTEDLLSTDLMMEAGDSPNQPVTNDEIQVEGLDDIIFDESADGQTPISATPKEPFLGDDLMANENNDDLSIGEDDKLTSEPLADNSLMADEELGELSAADEGQVADDQVLDDPMADLDLTDDEDRQMMVDDSLDLDEKTASDNIGPTDSLDGLLDESTSEDAIEAAGQNDDLDSSFELDDTIINDDEIDSDKTLFETGEETEAESIEMSESASTDTETSGAQTDFADLGIEPEVAEEVEASATEVDDLDIDLEVAAETEDGEQVRDEADMDISPAKATDFSELNMEEALGVEPEISLEVDNLDLDADMGLKTEVSLTNDDIDIDGELGAKMGAISAMDNINIIDGPHEETDMSLDEISIAPRDQSEQISFRGRTPNTESTGKAPENADPLSDMDDFVMEDLPPEEETFQTSASNSIETDDADLDVMNEQNVLDDQTVFDQLDLSNTIGEDDVLIEESTIQTQAEKNPKKPMVAQEAQRQTDRAGAQSQQGELRRARTMARLNHGLIKLGLAGSHESLMQIAAESIGSSMTSGMLFQVAKGKKIPFVAWRQNEAGLPEILITDLDKLLSSELYNQAGKIKSAEWLTVKNPKGDKRELFAAGDDLSMTAVKGSSGKNLILVGRADREVTDHNTIREAIATFVRHLDNKI